MNVRRFAAGLLAAALIVAVGCSSASNSRRLDAPESPNVEVVQGVEDSLDTGVELVRPTAEPPVRYHDEIIIIEKGADVGGRSPRGARLYCRQRDRLVPVPLKHTDVKGQISLYIGSVTVRQEYHNPYDETIEALYTFPLPENSAVRDFVMTVGERRIRGIIREREEAREIYEQAKRQGYRAALLTQERPNIFTQAVANIDPGRDIDIEITYFHTLPYEDGHYVFHFPMVVGPRFCPPGTPDPSPATYATPAEIKMHDIALKLDIDAGVPIESIVSPTHDIEVEKADGRRAAVRLAAHDSIPNKDFVLRYKVAGNKLQGALAVSNGTFALMLQPPATLERLAAADREMIFVLDCSGSMEGEPLALAKETLKRCLRRMRPEDTFQIVRFSDSSSSFGSRTIPATEANVRRAVRWVDEVRSEGGTNMMEGIQAALDFPHDSERYRIVSFLTDGFIGNEDEILAEVKKHMGEARLFSLGVGSSVNRHLLERMAHVGRGDALVVTLDESGREAADNFFKRIEHPALSDLRIDWGGMEVSEVYPSPLPDLFVGRPVVLLGRYEGSGRATVRVSGRAEGKRITMEVPVDLDQPDVRHKALTAVWARTKMAEMLDATAWVRGKRPLVTEIRALALEHGLVSPYTSFIAVDGGRRTGADRGTTVPVPVAVPKGVQFEPRKP